jgi:hypothetical protein
LEAIPSDTEFFYFSRRKTKTNRTVILPIVFYGCRNWPLIFREEHRLRVFENRLLGKTFARKRDEVTGEWRRLQNGEFNDLYSSLNIMKEIKLRGMRLVGHVIRMGDSKGAYKNLLD